MNANFMYLLMAIEFMGYDSTLLVLNIFHLNICDDQTSKFDIHVETYYSTLWNRHTTYSEWKNFLIHHK